MFWDIFRIALFAVVIFAFFHNRKYGALDNEYVSLVENSISPFYHKITESHNPNAIIFAGITKAPAPITDLIDKKLPTLHPTVCIFILNEKIVLQSIYDPDLQLELSFEDIDCVYISPLKKVSRHYCIGFDTVDCMKITFFTSTYRPWCDQQYKNILDPQPFLNILKNNFKVV